MTDVAEGRGDGPLVVVDGVLTREYPKKTFNPVFQFWAQQPDGYYCIVVRPLDPDMWIDVWFQKLTTRKGVISIDQQNKRVVGYPRKADLYFCPVGFTEMERRKDLVLPSRWLFADLDYVSPTECSFEPTNAWETSPGKWQAMWFCHNFIEPEDFPGLNRAVCRSSGADPGTWNANRLLRCPDTRNYKPERAMAASKAA